MQEISFCACSQINVLLHKFAAGLLTLNIIKPRLIILLTSSSADFTRYFLGIQKLKFGRLLLRNVLTCQRISWLRSHMIQIQFSRNFTSHQDCQKMHCNNWSSRLLNLDYGTKFCQPLAFICWSGQVMLHVLSVQNFSVHSKKLCANIKITHTDQTF